MQIRPEFFAMSMILFVPFAYTTFSISDACAVAGRAEYYTGTCSGESQSKEGKTCCWREPIEGSILGQKVCQTCKESCDAKGTCTETCTKPTSQAMEPTKPELSGPMQEGMIQEGNITTPDSDQKTGIFKDPTENNDTFSQDDIGNIE